MRLYREFQHRDDLTPLVLEGLTLEMLAQMSRGELFIVGSAVDCAHPDAGAEQRSRLRPVNLLEQLNARTLPFPLQVVHLPADHSSDGPGRARQFHRETDFAPVVDLGLHVAVELELARIGRRAVQSYAERLGGEHEREWKTLHPAARRGRSAFQRVAHRRVLVGEGAETGDGSVVLAVKTWR